MTSLDVLIAEDDPSSRFLLERSIAQWGFTPVVCSEGTEALARLRADDAPRIAVLDWVMPGMDGVDVCRAVRACNPPRQPYLILLTARSTRADIVAGLGAGANDYIVKPVDREELEARLQVAARFVTLQQRLADRRLPRYAARVQRRLSAELSQGSGRRRLAAHARLVQALRCRVMPCIRPAC